MGSGRDVASIRSALRDSALKTPLGFRTYLRRRHGAARQQGRPHAPWRNAVLQTRAEADEAQRQVERLGLPPHEDPPKNWDALAALDAVLDEVPQDGWVLDAGATLYSPLLPWLFLYGYRNLHGLNLEFDAPVKRGAIDYSPGDLLEAPYPDGRFDAIACLSVIEHGVDVPRYLREAARLL